jgi:hypothetical protein
MGRDEYVHVQILRLYEYRQLAIKAKWEMAELRSTTVAKVEVYSRQGPFVPFEYEAVLPQVPDGKGIGGNLEITDALHVLLAFYQRRNDEFHRRFTIVRIVSIEGEQPFAINQRCGVWLIHQIHPEGLKGEISVRMLDENSRGILFDLPRHA